MSSRVIVALRVAASPDRAFEAFTGEIGRWWRVLAFEPGDGGRLTETLASGKVFEIGRVRAWEPPHRLVFGWRQASFHPDQDTEVEVRFEAVGEETRVTVEHRGWDTVPSAHVARHGFPNGVFLQRHGEWWRELLGALRAEIAA